MVKRHVQMMAAVMLALVLVTAGCGSDSDGFAEVSSGDADGADGSDATGTDGGNVGDEAATDDGVDGGGGDDGNRVGADRAAFQTAPQATTPPAEPAPPGEGETPVGVEVQPVTFGRDIIFTADIAISVADVANVTRRATVAIEGLGGIVFGQSSRTEPAPQTTITYKVAPADFQRALTALGELGTVTNQTVTAEDVTDRVVDLDSRIQTAAASVERLRGFLAGASDLETIRNLEQQLLERETALEQLRGQARTLADQVGLATILVTISEAAPAVTAGFDATVSAYAGHDDGAQCPGDDDLAIDEDEPMSVCWTVDNTGVTHLGEFAITDDRLGVGGADAVLVAGSVPLSPGEQATFVWEGDADRDHGFDSRVRAIPVSEDGERLGLGHRERSVSAALAVDPDDSLPGFGDSLAASGRLLALLGSVLIVVLGAVVPFLPIVAVLGGVAWWNRRRARAAA